MNRQLCISVTFLDPLFHGKADGGEAEWPPSPMRLFQALLAGSRTGCRNRQWSPAHVDAFRWLERRQPPTILAPSARPGSGFTFFVPRNDADKELDREGRLDPKPSRPSRLCDGDTLHYIWALADGESASEQAHAELLCRQARCLLALGWGIDQVVGRGRILTDAEARALPGTRWQAWEAPSAGQNRLRVPARGSLGDLERVYQSLLGRTAGDGLEGADALRGFRRVAYLPQTCLPPRPCAQFELPEGVAMRQVDAVRVAAMLRSLVCRRRHREDFREQFEEDPEVYLAGHVNGAKQTPARFSYLPLPTIGHQHADGMIRRLLIAEPFGGDGRRADWAQNRLRGAALVDNDGNRRGVLRDLWRPSSQRVLSRYIAPARAWSSVTPVILPGFDDLKPAPREAPARPAKAEGLLIKALRHAGIPLAAVTDVFLRRAPFWAGSQHPRLYHRPSYLKSYPAWHVHLRFKEPIPGPIAVGAGRHCGLGVLASQAEP